MLLGLVKATLPALSTLAQTNPTGCIIRTICVQSLGNFLPYQIYTKIRTHRYTYSDEPNEDVMKGQKVSCRWHLLRPSRAMTYIWHCVTKKRNIVKIAASQ